VAAIRVAAIPALQVICRGEYHVWAFEVEVFLGEADGFFRCSLFGVGLIGHV
jgi:hypothetical protein